MKYVTSMAVGAGLSLLSPSFAADVDGRFALRSLANLTCGQVVDSIQRSDGETLEVVVSQLSLWLGGYLTHANRATPEVYDIVPFGAERDVLAVIVNRCEQLPEGTNFEAVTANVVEILSQYAVRRESPLRNVDGIIPLRDSMIVRVQEALIARGHFNGPPDGIIGPRTRAAIRSFQESRGVLEKDSLDIDALLTLLSAPKL